MKNLHLVFVILGCGCELVAVTNLVSGENRLRIMAAGLTLWMAADFLV